MAKQNRSAPVMQAVLDAVGDRLMRADESLIRIPEICEATGVNYGSVYHHFGSREGVIDAAYHQMFTKLAEEDLAVLQLVSVSSKTFEEYLVSMQGLIGTFASSDLRRARRALRARIVAASMMRPELRELIGETQSRLTTELQAIVEYGQQRGWLNRELSAHAVAVLIQVLLVGRTLDDVSTTPIDNAEWESSMAILLSVIIGSSQP
jgi:AcrR family transcriptional regulator